MKEDIPTLGIYQMVKGNATLDFIVQILFSPESSWNFFGVILTSSLKQHYQTSYDSEKNIFFVILGLLCKHILCKSTFLTISFKFIIFFCFILFFYLFFCFIIQCIVSWNFQYFLIFNYFINFDLIFLCYSIEIDRSKTCYIC